MRALATGIKYVRNVSHYVVGSGCLDELSVLVAKQKEASKNAAAVYLIDHYFQNDTQMIKRLGIAAEDKCIFVDSQNEPTTDSIDVITKQLKSEGFDLPSVVVGMGGGVAMDTAKAVANLLTNDGNAEDYQGWDLVKHPSIYKIAVPTISGTGAEATRTCVMTNAKTGLKLGMNSDYTVYDQIVMDPDLTATVPRDQYFYTGADAYIHCIESLSGSYRNPIGDAYSRETLALCRRVFLEGDMKSADNRERLMVASYLGGCAIATSYVGLVHPLSAGLSVVLGMHHCVANCVVMRAMKPYYPEAFEEFWRMVDLQKVYIPENICRDLSAEQHQRLYAASIVHEKPLINALGENYKEILTPEVVQELFSQM